METKYPTNDPGVSDDRVMKGQKIWLVIRDDRNLGTEVEVWLNPHDAVARGRWLAQHNSSPEFRNDCEEQTELESGVLFHALVDCEDHDVMVLEQALLTCS